MRVDLIESRHLEASRIKHDVFLADAPPLLRAAYEGGMHELERLVCEEGADVNAKGRHSGTTALSAAALHGHSEAIEYLVWRGADVHAADLQQWTALAVAAAWGHANVVEYLLQAGAEPVNKALMMACNFDYQAVVEMLLDAGADAAARADRFGTTPLFVAAACGSIPVMERLIEAGANVHTRDTKGCTVLMDAATAGRTEAIKFLVSKGADVNAADQDGWTALMCAAQRGSLETVEQLLALGADVHAQNEDGNTALAIASRAAEKYHREEKCAVVQYLRKLVEPAPSVATPTTG